MATVDRTSGETDPAAARPRSAEVELPMTLAVPLTRAEDGALRVTGTRIPIDRIVHAFLHGQTAEQFCQDFPTVTLSDVHAVIAYYLQNRDLVDEYLRLREHEAATLRERIEGDFPVEELRERLVKRRAELKAHSDALR
ncbi:MAG TPA: DUF433 domain-containing protein [Chloroflexota bacterium]|nr:DUF433 domain-containing protein [Chloroflexota bacterium]